MQRRKCRIVIYAINSPKFRMILWLSYWYFSLFFPENINTYLKYFQKYIVMYLITISYPIFFRTEYEP